MSTDSLKKNMVEHEVTDVSDDALDDRTQIARAQQEIDHRLTKWQTVKAYPRACIYLLILIWSFITAGFEYQASGVILAFPSFRRDFGYAIVSDGTTLYTLEALWQSAITGGATAAMVVSSFSSTTIVDYTGRKWLVTGCVILTMAFF